MICSKNEQNEHNEQKKQEFTCKNQHYFIRAHLHKQQEIEIQIGCTEELQRKKNKGEIELRTTCDTKQEGR